MLIDFLLSFLFFPFLFPIISSFLSTQIFSLTLTLGPWVEQHVVQANWQNLLDTYEYYLVASSCVDCHWLSILINTFLLGWSSKNGICSHHFSKMFKSIKEAIKTESSSMSQVLMSPCPCALFFWCWLATSVWFKPIRFTSFALTKVIF
jgi:hypothetical protein